MEARKVSLMLCSRYSLISAIMWMNVAAQLVPQLSEDMEMHVKAGKSKMHSIGLLPHKVELRHGEELRSMLNEEESDEMPGGLNRKASQRIDRAMCQSRSISQIPVRI